MNACLYNCAYLCAWVHVWMCVCACHSVYVEVRTSSGVSFCHLSCLRQDLLFFTIAYAGFPGFLLSLSPTSSWNVDTADVNIVDLPGCCVLRSSLRQLISSCSVFLTRILHLCLVDTGPTPGLNYISEQKWCMVLLGRSFENSCETSHFCSPSARQLLLRIHVQCEIFSIIVEGQGLVWDQPHQEASLSVSYLSHTAWGPKVRVKAAWYHGYKHMD